MSFLSDADKQAIRDAIRDAELRTSGELVTVLARASDDYRYIPLLWAGLLALAVPGLMFLAIDVFDLWIEPEIRTIYLIQVLVFVALAALFRLTPIKMFLIPGAVKRQRAGRLASEQFFRQGLHHTRGHTGVLLFVSVAERYVEIVADRGINDKVPANIWDDAVADFVRHVKDGQVTQGFLNTIKVCGELLSRHAPAEKDDVNELPNHLIEL